MANDRTVHIVDDDEAVRRSLVRLLESAGFDAVAYATPQAFLDVASQLVGGCLLLDVWMPGLNGLEIQGRLRDLGVTLPVIVMTGHGDVPTAVRAMRAGAVDFIEKPFDDEVLLKAIETGLAQGANAEREREIAAAVERIAALSPRERQVLDALMAGRPNKVIAFELGLSVRTVEVHRARMMERLGTRQLAEAIRVAVLAQLAPGAGSRRRKD